MATTRQFGIITSGLSSLSAGICVNSIDYSEQVETAQARTETGEISDMAGFSRSQNITVNGVIDTAKGNLAQAGNILTLDGKNWLIQSVSKTESNTSFVEATITAKRADNAEIYIVSNS